MSALARAPGASADAQCPDGQPCIVVHLMGQQNGTQVITVGEFDPLADAGPPYHICVAVTSCTDQPVGPAVSISALLGQLDPPIPPGAVTFTEAKGPTGRPSTLTTDDLDDPSDPSFPFPSGLMPSIFLAGFDDGGAFGYVRPQRNDADLNGLHDYWQTNGNAALELTVHTTGHLLEPTIRPSRTTITSGKSVSFRASFDSAPGTQITYTWDFGDGATRVTDGATTSHVYKTGRNTSTSNARVTVHGADGSIGQSKTVMITVNPTKPPKPPKPPKPDPHPGTGTNPDPNVPATGPDHSEGTRPGTAAASKPGHDTKGTPSGTVPPAALSAPPVTTAAGPEGAVLLHGVVIGNADTVSAASKASSATAPAAHASSSHAWQLNPVVVWGLAVLLLLGTGAARESSWAQDRLRRFRRAS